MASGLHEEFSRDYHVEAASNKRFGLIVGAIAFLFGCVRFSVGKIATWKKVFVEAARKTSRGLTVGMFQNLCEFPNVQRLFTHHAWILGALSWEKKSRFPLRVSLVLVDMELDVSVDFAAIWILQCHKRHFELFGEFCSAASNESQTDRAP